MSLNKQLGDWYPIFKDIVEGEDFKKLGSQLTKEYKTKEVYPKGPDIFRAFSLSPYSKTRVIIIGQDPYHDGSANGLAFANNDNVLSLSSSLRNIRKELEEEYDIQRNVDLLCPTVAQYVGHVMGLEEEDDILAHIYVRHFGDMYGGQMIRKRNPGSGKMYDFNNVEELKATVRERLNDDMADEANRCFEFAMQLFEELGDE